MNRLLLIAHIELHPISESEIQHSIWEVLHDSCWYDYVSAVQVGIRNGLSDIPSLTFEITLDIPKQWSGNYHCYNDDSPVVIAFSIGPGRMFDQEAIDALDEILDNFPFIESKDQVEYEI